MYSRDSIFLAEVLSPMAFDKMVDEFSEATNYHYATQASMGYDSFPQYPLYIEYVMGNRLVFIMGLVSGRSPGLCLLKGVVKASGFKEIVHDAWEKLDRVPAEMTEVECLEKLKSLRKRLRYAATKLAEMAGMKRCDSDLEFLWPSNSTQTTVPQD